MATQHTVKRGDSWASIAGQYYGTQRWLIELAQANGLNTSSVLQPGQVIDIPDFDLSQTPVITNDQWAATPTGMNGNQLVYGNSGGPQVPSFAPPQVPSFTSNATGTTGKNQASGLIKPNTGESESYRAQFYEKPYNRYTASGVTPGSAMDTQLSAPIVGQRFRADQMAGIPPGARPTPTGQAGGGLSQRRNTPNQQFRGRSFSEQFANTHGMSSAQFNGQTTAPSGGSGTTGNSGLTRGQQADAARYQAQADAVANGTYNAANGALPETPASDMAWIADAARYTGLAIYEYGKTGNRNQLPNRINARVAAELPFRGAGFTSTEEFMMALGYRVDADGNWTRYDPQVVTSYRTQTYVPPAGGGHGGGGGGYARGPAAVQQGYGPGGMLVNWRISG